MATALVTGASSGLGREYARQLARAGHDLVLVARNGTVLTQLAEALEMEHGARAEVLPADLATRQGVALVAERLDDATRPVSLLVNNAGFGLGKPFPDNDLGAEESALDVMVRAVMILSHHAARAMRRRGRGAILNVASVACETGAGTYSAHKAWVRAFTEGLAAELAGTGVTATCVMPGLTRTEFFDRAGVDLPGAPAWAWSTAEQVVGESLAAVRRGSVLVTPHPAYKAAMTAMRVAPRWFTRAVVAHLPHM
ncbi:SDR family NAD(P)-dependent oxidoreductase [Schaalia sp. 19OD2882]|uniref:SDR family NAD(P)-dependent oxidoreductase n=1 Tax=Schaalia sp. 19OD2882 TaxID=2794089 RepID=UPI001C1EA8DB|nr:SDR family NAD(P)-dependent oxidoreductase [Schaalia sp. 19OD2882]QWW19320.1 SDR family NAD(P)-dependent oxidoreductase [Schaalia sp. 19OD2882]